MRKVVVVLACGLGLAACGSHSHLNQVASNPQAQQDQKAAEQIVQACLPKGNLLTHSGRQRILSCIAPPGHEAAFQACATKDLASTGILTHGQRARFYQGLAVCVEKNR